MKTTPVQLTRFALVFPLILLVFSVSANAGEPGTAVVTPWQNDATAAASLTIDDNNRPDHEWWLAMGEKYDVKFTWFVITDSVGKNSAQYGTWDEFAALNEAGHDIQSHTVDHLPQFPKSGPLGIEVNYSQSILDIESKIPNSQVRTLAYPMGLKAPNDSTIAEKHYIAARGVSGTLNKLESVDFFNVNSLSTGGYLGGFPIPGVAESKHWAYLPNLITVGNPFHHGWLSVHSHGMNDESKQAVTGLLDYLTEKPGDFWVASFTDIAQYAQQRAASKVEVNLSETDEIRFTLTDTLDDTRFDQPLTVKLPIADDWQYVQATQGDTQLTVKLIDKDGKHYALVNCVPDAGVVVMKPVTSNP